MHWGWDWVDCFWNKLLLEHSMFLQLSSFSQKSSLLNIFSLCKKSLNFDTLFWAFPAWKLMQKGVSITEIRTGLLIIVFKWICVYSLGAFFFCLQFAIGIFLLWISISWYCWGVCLMFFFPYESFLFSPGKKIDCYTAVWEDFVLHLFENVIAPGASC